jgi:chromatin remodeling complex protein RSC6
MAKTKKIEATASAVPAVTEAVIVETPVAPAAPVAPVAEAAPVPDVKPKAKKAKKTKVAVTEVAPVVVEETPVAATEVETVVEVKTETVEESVVVENVVIDENVETVETVETVEETVEETVAPVEKKKRKVITKEKLIQTVEDLQKDLVPVLESINNKKLLKSFKTVVTDVYRILKIKTSQKKAKDATNSGFMRPVKPSEALEKFLATFQDDDKKPLTRAHLTTLICKYIKEKDLQNPNDRRIIFPDEELKTLFQITENDTEPLTYYNIQKRIQPHVSRIEEVETTA